MKVFLVAAFFVIASSLTYAETSQVGDTGTNASSQDAPYTVIDKGANYNVWQKTAYETDPNGVKRPHVHRYVELASGLNYLDDNGAWTSSQELIEPYPSGAIARRGPYQVIFANNLNTAGAIDFQALDGKRLRSNIVGLGYYDRSTGNSVLIAELQDSLGELVADNKILYTNAFIGVNADVCYTYRKSGLEQDVILREQPPIPESFGLNSDATELEVMTAFINPPAANVSTVDGGTPDLEPDQNINWGATSLGKSRAFDLGDQSTRHKKLDVSKQFVNVQGQHVLLEKVSLKQMLSQLSKLPAQAGNKRNFPVLVSKQALFPKIPVARATLGPVKLASASVPDKGYVLDYVTISSAETNFTFKSDTTYYIPSGYVLAGTTIIEGNAVIKMAEYGAIVIAQNGTLVCDTAPYRPAVFTSTNDSSVGESFGTNSPSLGDVFEFLEIQATNAVLHDLRFGYCWYPIVQQGVSMCSIWNSQFENVDTAFTGYNLQLHNVLIARFDNDDGAVETSGPITTAENVTADGGNSFLQPDNLAAFMALTNCLITGQPSVMPGYYPYSSRVLVTNSTILLASPSSPIYQTAGGGYYYLTNGSPYKNYGTTNVNSTLLAELRQKTTHSPVVFTNYTFASATNFLPQAARDTNTNLDIGYHYDPIDYAFGGCKAISNMTFTAGTAVGWFRASSGTNHAGYGICITNQQVVAFQGTASSPCYWVRLNTVQEDDVTAGYGPGGLDGEDDQVNHNIAISPMVQANFCRFSTMASEGGSHARDDNGYLIVQANNSEFYSGSVGGYGMAFNFTNCLFDRCMVQNLQGWTGDFINIEDCTFHGTSLVLTPTNSAFSINVKNCSFDGTSISVSGYGNNATYDTYDYNAYTNSSGILPVGGSHNVIVTNGFNWQTSWLGNFYLPTNSPVIDKGSTNASYLGLYHFTSQTNQTVEANSAVDIGYHYVATDQFGNPLDADADGIPDYIEDSNGNGIYDAGDVGNWQLSPYNGLSSTNGLQIFTPLK